MIVPLVGNVTYPITLDPTVWIFDDRKVLIDDMLKQNPEPNVEHVEVAKQMGQRSNKVYSQSVRPPVNKSITRFESEKILKNTYVMPIEDFIERSEIKDNAQNAKIITNKENVIISLDDLKSCYLLFAIKGKPLIKDGPVHLYFKDPSKQKAPIKSVQKIIVQ